ncbi:right-handed parallel beta-helix repeat-containing protein [Hyphomicrobium sp.]|uniref:right-handed parallel beta-helix repeat-containing protein n=1 Tax=Hyphomicrobium sp. TaxID=82 RepID=UPI003F717CBF
MSRLRALGLVAAAALLIPLAAPPSGPGMVAFAQQDDVPAKEAFDAAKELGTIEGWNAFLESYPEGFLSNLARAYVKKLKEGGPDTTRDTAPEPAPTVAQPKAKAKPAAPASEEASAASNEAVSAPAALPGKPAVARGAKYMGFAEQFNRYYTDPAWKPSKTVFVSPDGRGDGASPEAPAAAKDAVLGATPGTKIHFLRGKYDACFNFTKETGGTYDEPVVLYAERNTDKSIGVSMLCCKSGRASCFNFEAADYIAVDGFHMTGGKYGVRVVGEGYDASQHSRGIAILRSTGNDQDRDPFFSGQSDWNVWEANLGFGAKKDDGHGIYISNGSDWNIVRFNETYGNLSSDFQINADPASTCADEGIPFDDPRCDAYAGEGEGGRGASDYFLVEGNYFHDGASSGPNFTSVRRSVVRNNVFGPQVRHNVSFWQETDNPKLGSSDNKVLHNLFITTGKHGVQFTANSTRNLFANNVLLGVTVDGGAVAANPSALLMEVDGTASDNVYRGNLYVSGRLEGREPGNDEISRDDFSASWFAKFPTVVGGSPNDFTPTADSPALGAGKLLADSPADRNGTARAGDVDLGPIEVK